MKMLTPLIMFLMMANIACANEFTSVRIAPPLERDLTHRYFTSVLTMALEKTADTYGDFEIVYAAGQVGQEEAFSHVRRKKHFDLIWMMTSEKREYQLRPIRVPLFKGLLGYRVAAINTADLPVFAKLDTMEDLKSLVAGQGIDWPDTEILNVNGFTVIGTSNYADLYSLLKNKRIDYFPRGVLEIWPEVERLNDETITVDPYILLRYKAPIYFFVHSDNDVLYKRLETGLYMALEDGSFDNFFYEFFNLSDELKRLRLGNRRIFDIENPLLTPMTPVDDNRLWLVP